MKRTVGFLALVLSLFLLAGCGGGDVSEVKRNLGKCERFTPHQIEKAMEEVEKEFKAHYDGCTLLRLSYDEEDTAQEADGWAEHYGVADVIVLKSDFYVDDSGRMVTMNPDSLYKNWNWILVKTAFGWEIRDCGYG